MRHLATQSTSSDESVYLEEGSTRQSSPETTPSTLHSANSSITSNSRTLQNVPKRSSFKSGLKASRSAPSLGVRFDMPEVPKMPRVPAHASSASQSNGSRQSSSTKTVKPSSTSMQSQTKSLLKKRSNRYSAPVLRSQNDVKRSSQPPLPHNPRFSSAPGSALGSRATSFQSIASAPAALESSTPTPSHPPSQYNPLQHYLPCVFEGCTKHYTPSLLGPTFYSPQQPYQLIRKRGLCPGHAHEELKRANSKAKSAWESMRQNAGRKTLGLIAAEFEIYVQQFREDRVWESDAMEARQRQRILRGRQTSTKGKEKEGEGWNWKYTPRPCTKKGCTKQWYSPYDNRLFLFYHTTRRSGLRPMVTLCPPCARADVEDAEERIQERKCDAGASPEWVQWCEQIKNDRVMEEEYWLKAQERVVREKGVVASTATLEVTRKAEAPVEKMKKKSNKLKDVCIVM